jgi:dihydroneopterin aldolase
MDKIILEGVKVQTLIGWHAWERTAPQTIILDLIIGIAPLACHSDNLTDTIDYEKVVNDLRLSLATQHFLLLEALAEHVAHLILVDFKAPWVKVKVIKPHILTDVACVGVEIERGQLAG